MSDYILNNILVIVVHLKMIDTDALKLKKVQKHLKLT